METNALVRYKSGISQAYWCDTSDNLAEFQLAKLAFDTTEKQELSWFDKLFEGGILLPEEEDDSLHPLTMLVSGPPGCGKTTLVSELCYRLAVNEQGNQKSLSTLYISTDAETKRMINNVIDLGWEKARKFFIPFDPHVEEPKLKQELQSIVGVWGREKFLSSIDKQDILSAMIEAALNSLDKWVLKANTAGIFMPKIRHKLRNKPIESASGGGVGEDRRQYIPDILVIDSLNILNPEGQTKFFQAFVKACKATKLVVFMLIPVQEIENTNSGNFLVI